MRSRLVLWIAIAVVAAAVAGVLVAAAGADDTTTLPDLSASELIARMSDHAQAPQAISGDISWTNELFGALPFMPDHVAQPAAVAAHGGRLRPDVGAGRQGPSRVAGAGRRPGPRRRRRGGHAVDVRLRRRHRPPVRVGCRWIGGSRRRGAGGPFAGDADSRARERVPRGSGAFHDGGGQRPDPRRRTRRVRPDDDARRDRHGAGQDRGGDRRPYVRSAASRGRREGERHADVVVRLHARLVRTG